MQPEARESGHADEDRELVDRAKHGDGDAFGALVDKYQHRVIGLAWRLTANAADAEDVAQDAFFRAFRALRTFRGASAFRTWLFQIVVNTARTFVSRRTARPDGISSALSQPPEESLASGQNLERSLMDRDRVEQALAALPDDLREAVVLRDVEGLDYREIAAVLDVPIGTVESRIFRGRERLRASLGAPSLTKESVT